ncbi:MAG: GYD domain-containing protein [Caulobacteraceae bacterium]
MATYIQLLSWTEQGARAVKDSPSRLDAAKRAIKALGGEFKSFYLTMGAYDAIAVYEAPNDEAAARFALALAQSGNVRTQTLKAFTETEYRDILGSLN